MKEAKVYNKRQKRSELQPVLIFEKARHPMLVNKTNRRRLAEMFGPDALAAVGKSITLEPAIETIGGKAQDTIRIRAAS